MGTESNIGAQIIYFCCCLLSASCNWNFKNSTSISKYPKDKSGKSITKQMLFPEAKVCSIYQCCLSVYKEHFSVKLSIKRRACAWNLGKVRAVVLLAICGTVPVSTHVLWHDR